MSYRCRCRLLGLLVLLVTTGTVSHAATFVCPDTACLVARIHEANGNAHASNRIVLTADTYTFLQATASSPDGDQALPTITKALTLEAGRTPVVLARPATAPLFRLVTNAAGVAFTIRGLTIQGFAVSTVFFQDGGCLLNHGTLRLVDSLFQDCEARIGGAVRSFGSLDVLRSVFQYNTASFLAGAIAADGPRTVIRNTTFLENTAETCGAVFALGAPEEAVLLRQTTWVGNSSVRTSGGALCTQGLDEMTTSHFIDNHSALHGGGHFAFEGTLDIRQTAYTFNTAEVNGGALSVTAGPGRGLVTMSTSHVLFNAAGFGRGGGLHNGSQTPMSLRQSQVSGNQAPLGPDCAGAFVVRQTHIGDPSGCTLVPE